MWSSLWQREHLCREGHRLDSKVGLISEVSNQQCDQMLDFKVAQYPPKRYQKVASSVFTHKGMFSK